MYHSKMIVLKINAITSNNNSDQTNEIRLYRLQTSWNQGQVAIELAY